MSEWIDDDPTPVDLTEADYDEIEKAVRRHPAGWVAVAREGRVYFCPPDQTLLPENGDGGVA